MTNVRTHHHSTPRYGDLALAADLDGSITAALDELDEADPVEQRGAAPQMSHAPRTTSRPVVDVLARLAADEDTLLTPDAVLTLDLDGLGTVQLELLRVAVFESGARRMRLAGALGAALALRTLDDD